MKKSIALIIMITLVSFSCLAAKKIGITMADSIKINDTKLILNGLGVRKATWLRIKVYVGGLYLVKKSSNIQEILDSRAPKYLVMDFVRGVSAKKMRNGWTDAFDDSLEKDKAMRSKIQGRLDKLNSYMSDIEEGDKIVFTFLANSVKVKVKNQDKGSIAGADFSRALLAVWFINAKDQGLKEGLLGKN